MIELRDTVHIHAPRSTVWAWLADLPLHYRAWHPAHGRCWYVRGEALVTGAILGIEEVLHGRPHRLRLLATEVVPNQALRYSSPGLRGAFLLEDEDGGTRFTATLAFGTSAPLVGPLADLVLGRLFRGRLAAVAEHMREESRNLKELLEHAVT